MAANSEGAPEDGKGVCSAECSARPGLEEVRGSVGWRSCATKEAQHQKAPLPGQVLLRAHQVINYDVSPPLCVFLPKSCM